MIIHQELTFDLLMGNQSGRMKYPPNAGGAGFDLLLTAGCSSLPHQHTPLPFHHCYDLLFVGCADVGGMTWMDLVVMVSPLFCSPDPLIHYPSPQSSSLHDLHPCEATVEVKLHDANLISLFL